MYLVIPETMIAPYARRSVAALYSRQAVLKLMRAESLEKAGGRRCRELKKMALDLTS